MTEKDTSNRHVSLENREAMLRTFFDAIRLSFCGAANIVPNLQDVDWKSVARLSMMQQVVALVYIALLKDRCGCPDDVFTFIETNAMGRMIRNAIKQDNAVELLKESYQQGIKLAVMKGQEIANCYDDPLSRISSDIDLLVDSKDIKAAYEFLNERMKVVERNEGNGHYAVFTDPVLGALELHDTLFTKRRGDVWFPGAELLYEKPKFILADDHYILDPTQQFNFICYHLLHHFVSGGISIQMCIDVEMYYRKHKNEINIAAINKEFERIGSTKFISSVAGLLRQSGIDSELPFFCDDKQAVLDLAEDILLGCGKKIADDEAVQVRYSTRTSRLQSKHSPFYSVYHRISNFAAGIKAYLFPYSGKVKASFPDQWYPVAYVKYVTKNVKNRAARKPGQNHDAEVERREKLLKELNLL